MTIDTNIFYTTDKIKHHDAEGKLDADVMWKVVDRKLCKFIQGLADSPVKNFKAEMTPSRILELRTAANARQWDNLDDGIEFCDNALKVFSDNSRVFVICC